MHYNTKEKKIKIYHGKFSDNNYEKVIEMQQGNVQRKKNAAISLLFENEFLTYYFQNNALLSRLAVHHLLSTHNLQTKICVF